MPHQPDLPPEVIALARRLGARQVSQQVSQQGEGSRSSFGQTGTLRNLGDERWMRFSARQWIAADALAFSWRAKVGPLGLVHVEDALIDGQPIGAVKVMGLIPLKRAATSAGLIKGELQRYLAELPWSPDALLSNPSLKWQVRSENELRVSASLRGVEGSVDITLDAEGLPHTTFAMRPALSENGFVEREWHGTFADYREVEGRLVPFAGRVGWTIEGEYFEVWRGALTDWTSAVS